MLKGIGILVLSAIMAFGLLVTNEEKAYAASTYYVATNGSDSNPGTLASPFLTIQKAATVAVAGDTVNIRGGTYRETITPANSGTAGNPITYQPYNNEVVTVSGADIADGGWTLAGGGLNANVYKKTITMTNGYNDYMTNNTTLLANQVFDEGQMMVQARWPNLPDSNDLFNRNHFRDATIGTWSTTTPVTLNDSGIPNISGGWAGGTIWINGWFISHTRDITSHTGTQLTLSGGMQPFDGPDGVQFKKFYYLTGKLGALDAEKEWHYDHATTTLYLWQTGGGSPTNIEVKKRNYAFDLSNKSYITIKKLKIFAATITTNTSSTNITLDELNAKYINHGVKLTEADVNYSHTGQVDTTPGATGIRLMGANSIIMNSEVAFSSSMGIMLGAGNTAHNNLVHDIGYEGTYASAIAPLSGTNGQQITNNTMYRLSRSGVDMRPPSNQNVNIGYNNIYDYSMLSTDTGGIYSWGDSNLTGTRIHHNWIHDTKAITNGMGIHVGIYFDQNAGPAQVDHNVVWMPGGGTSVGDIYVQHKPNRVFSHLIYNNTFASTNVPISYKNENSEATTTFDIMKNNIFRDEFHITYISQTPSGTNSLYQTQDPLFVGTGTGGLAYRIQSGSPARNAGAVISGVTNGHMESAPDIGAYEYGGTDWVPGYVAPGGGGTNIALGKTATQSSTYNACVASRGVDGNTNGNGEANITHTQLDAQGWWMVDLGANYNIGDIKVWNRSDSELGRLNDYYVRVLNASQVEVWSSHQTSFPNPMTTVNAGGTTGRYVKIQLTGTNYLHLGEVQVFESGGTSTVAAPVFNPAAGTYTSAQSVTMTTATPGAEIRYTTDGSTPTSSSTLYTGPVSVPVTTTLKAIGIKAGWTNSSVSTAAYTINASTNIALGKTATQSSTYNACVASRGVDGNTNGNGEANITHTQLDAQGWWMVDLGANYNIGDIKVWNRSDSELGRLNDYYVRVLNASQVEVWSSHQTSFPNPMTTVNAGGTTGRYVKIQLTGTNYLHLGEVQVFESGGTSGVYEAEHATLSGGAAVNTDHTGYTGTGFVDGYGTLGATTTFTVNVASAGSKNVELRYANGQLTARTVSIYVNGTKIKQTSLPNLANWDTWGVKTEALTLLAGNNTITYKYDSGDTAAVNLDKITVSP